MNSKLCFQVLLTTQIALTCLIYSSVIAAQSTQKKIIYQLYTQPLPPYSMAYKNGRIIQGSSGAQHTNTKDIKITGLAVEIVEQMFKRAGLQAKVIMLPWARVYRAIERTPNSCLFPIQRTQMRESQFRWISPLIINQTGLFTRIDSPLQLNVLNDISKSTVASYRGSATTEYLKSLGYSVNISNNEFNNLKRLSRNRVEVWAADTLTAGYLIKTFNMKEIHNQLTFFTSLRSLACNLTLPSIVIAKLRKQLKNMYTDGSIQILRKKYQAYNL